MVTIIEKDIYTSSLCFYGTTRPTDVVTQVQLGQTYALDLSSVMLYRNREPDINGAFPPTQKRINSISIEPLWDFNYIDKFAFAPGPTTYYAYYHDLNIQPFIASQRLSNLTQNFFSFSASDDTKWTLNQNGPPLDATAPNDIHYDDKFILQPWEDLKIRLHGVTLSSTLPAGGAGDAARLQLWNDTWISPSSIQPVAKIRIELEEFNPSSQYYHRVNLNGVQLNDSLDAIILDQDVTLLDLREGSSTLQERPFDRLFYNNYFQLQNLDFRGAYPWGGLSTTRFMYSILLHTEGKPTATRYIRKYVGFQGGTATDLETNGLLQNIGPLNMQRGQYLTARIYAFQSSIPVVTEAHSARQMPAFWLNGVIT